MASKLPENPVFAAARRRPRAHWVRCLVLLCLSVPALLFLNHDLRQYLAVLIGQKYTNVPYNSPKTAAHRAFYWNDITPSESIEYVPCFGDFRCARLSMPLNWNATVEEQQKGPRIAVAITKYPAKVPVSDPRYGGAILLNPGGPGESGVYQVLTDGEGIQTIVDSPIPPKNSGSVTAKYFDIISFDPRGVNNTTPKLRCFPNAMSQQAWVLQHLDYGLLWDSDSILAIEWARAEALGSSCSDDGADGAILPYLNTAQVAGDMLRIVDEEAKWRERESLKQLKASNADAETTRQVQERTAFRAGQEKLQYWGMSYGTLLGSTFAALYPHRVGRLILDGVVDPADHYAGDGLTQLQDSDMIMTKFSEYCWRAGPEKCPLAAVGSAAEVEARFTSIMMSMKHSPIAVPVPGTTGRGASPEVVTYGDIHLHLLSAMYFPFATVEDFFTLLAALEERNATSDEIVRVAAAKQGRLDPTVVRECEVGGGPAEACVPYVSGMGSFQATTCMDTGGLMRSTKEEFSDYLAVLRSQGRWISPSWARNKLSCLGYKVGPVWRPDLSFKTQEWDNTSHPLLIISNTHDPVTTLRNGRRVSTLFPGSVLLQQDSQGHCSHSSPSLCTGLVVREYFQTGNLPLQGAICQPETRPFVGCVRSSGNSTDCTKESAEEEALWQAMVKLADPFGLRRTE